MPNASEIVLKDQRVFKFKDQFARDSICREYDSSVVYMTDDYCYNDNTFYRCKADNTTGNFDITKWEATDIGAELNKISDKGLTLAFDGEESLIFGGNNSNADSNTIDIPVGIIPPPYSASETYTPGMYRVYNNRVYKCTNPITIPEPWNIAHWAPCNLYEEFSNLSLAEATSTSSGLMSASDKRKLDSLIPAEGVEF